jgi:RNA polymerase sigma-70 factor (sigma-E family)
VVKDSEYAEFVYARWMTLVRTAVLLGASHHEAEDLAQTTFIRCYLAWSKVVGAENPDAYVSRILVNAFRQSRRRRWWGERPSADLPEAGVPDHTGAVDDADAVARALGRLGPGQRDVVVLRYFLHLSETETAEALGVPVGTAKSRLSRALKQLAADKDLAEIRGGTS